MYTAALHTNLYGRVRKKRTQMAIKKSAEILAETLGTDESFMTNNEDSNNTKPDHVVPSGKWKNHRVKANDGLPFGAVMHILRENRRDVQYMDLTKFAVFIMLFVYVQFELRRVFDSHFQGAGIKDALLEEWLVEPEMPGSPFADERKFATTGNWEEFFLWMEGPFLGVLYRNEWYNDQPRGNYSGKDEHLRYMGTQSHIMGKIMMRQVRGVPIVKKVLDGGRDYRVHPQFEDSDFVLHSAKNGTVSPIYGTFMDDMSKIEGVSTGPMTWTMYGRQSWLHVFSKDVDEASKLIQHLKENLYVDQATRIVTIDFVLINPSSNVITSVRLIWESTTQGLMRHKAHIMAMPINLYRTLRQRIRAGVEFLFVCGLLWLTISELREMIHHKPSLYFSSLWNRLECLNILLFWCGIGAHFLFVQKWSWGGINWIEGEDNQYLDIYDSGYSFQLNARLAAGNTLLSFLKVFKYLQVSDRFNLLWITLGKAVHDLVSFLIIFSLFMIGFGIVGMLIFGPDIENYSTMTATLFTLFQMLLGDFDYPAMSESAPLVAPIYFATYIIAVFFILMNMMISIIIMGFEQAKSSQAKKQANYVKVPFVYDTLTTKFKTFMLRLQKAFGVVKLKPHEFRKNNHAVSLLSDPKKQVKIANAELLAGNNFKEEAKDILDPTTLSATNGSAASKKETKEGETSKAVIKAKRAAKKAVFLRKEVSRTRYEHWLDNLELATSLKKLFNSPGIIRAYKRLLAVESRLDSDVYDKILSVDNLTTVMGYEAAIKVVFLYRKIVGNSQHDSGEDHKYHSDSWHIIKTAEDVALMQTALDNVLGMVTLLMGEQAGVAKRGGGGGGGTAGKRIPDPPPPSSSMAGSAGVNGTKVVPAKSKSERF